MKWYKIVVVALVFLMLTSVIASGAMAGFEHQEMDEFQESISSEPLEIDGEILQTSISDWHDLQDVRNDLGGNYVLTNDLTPDTEGYLDYNDPATEGWLPIGNNDDRFTGNFDGQNHTITGLYINCPSTDYIGLFGYVGFGGVVRNIGVVDAYVSGFTHVGALVGCNAYGTVSNSYATGDVSGEENVGGLVGRIRHGKVENSYATGNVSSGSSVGGLVGMNWGKVENSYATGHVSGNDYVGGFVGYNKYSMVLNSYATGTVNGNDYVGGLIGSSWGGFLSDSHATGTVSGNDHVGGLVGYSWGGTLYHSYATGTVSGNDHVGGLGGSFETDIYKDRLGAYLWVFKSYATGDVSGTRNRVGGLVGYNSVDSTLNSSYAVGDVSGDSQVGGLVGVNVGTVANCYATSNVSGGELVGGLVGSNDGGTVNSSYAVGDVSGDSQVGGLVGVNVGTVANSFYDKETTGQSDTGKGTPKTTVEMKTQSTFTDAGWNFDYIWHIPESINYPLFQWQVPPDDDNGDDESNELGMLMWVLPLIAVIALVVVLLYMKKKGEQDER